MTSITSCAVEPGLLGEMQPFRQRLHQPGDADLVDHLGQLPRPDLAHAPAGLRVGRDRPARPWRNPPRSPPHMMVSCAVLRARLPARHRRVDEAEAAPLRLLGQFARDVGARPWCDRRRSRPASCRRRRRRARASTERRSSSLPTQANTMSRPSRRLARRRRAARRRAWRPSPAPWRRCGCRRRRRGRRAWPDGPPSDSPSRRGRGMRLCSMLFSSFETSRLGRF